MDRGKSEGNQPSAGRGARMLEKCVMSRELASALDYARAKGEFIGRGEDEAGEEYVGYFVDGEVVYLYCRREYMTVEEAANGCLHRIGGLV